MAIGVPEVLILALLGVPLVAAVFLWLGLSRRARRMGFGSTVEYLRSAPRSDAEKRDAADLAVKGLLWCTLGLLFSPLVLIGVVPPRRARRPSETGGHPCASQPRRRCHRAARRRR
jgi:hypothetical protein